ncbi:hydrophobin family protein [Aspergillus ellipticus CBS 707.79]|uniref:Hydrophobin n=1 Tax=Aspergillus ellipticus CBS 707.79 TaxID=1448320 RepID=A0A319CQX1_9EURO|nr:hydrophobin family protein [Aspergillus ellipticus CBS 707.79]
MKFITALSVLAIATTAFATPTPKDKDSDDDCVGTKLCCGSLTTPLDSTIDPIVEDLGINLANVVGSIGLDCKPYDHSCPSAPQCCTEANVGNGLLALGCSDA